MSAFDKVAILGLGLMGGSLAAALKQGSCARQIFGWGYRDTSLIKAKEKGLIDSYSLDLAEAVGSADIVVVCSPAKVAEQLLIDVCAVASDKTVITDVASVKGNLQAALTESLGVMPANVVLGHPIAGSEHSGIDAADAKLYINHSVILTPCGTTGVAAKKAVTALWQSVGATVTEMTVEAHDQILAGTSHLPHLLAFNMIEALAKLPSSHDVFKYAAGGLRDFTRIAASDPQMWAEIALTNKAAIVELMAAYRLEFESLLSDIQSEDEQALIARFSSAKKSRDYFSSLLLEQRQKSGV